MTDTDLAIESLDALSHPELVARYMELFGKKPRCRSLVWLRKQLAFAIQERALGGLSGLARRRLRDLMQEIDAFDGVAPVTTETPAGAARRQDALQPGTLLTRVWHDRTLRALVLEDLRIECEGTIYRSLSAAARAITGSNWNGRAFFGLPPRRTR